MKEALQLIAQRGFAIEEENIKKLYTSYPAIQPATNTIHSE
jgi:hypothetical protein